MAENVTITSDDGDFLRLSPHDFVNSWLFPENGPVSLKIVNVSDAIIISRVIEVALKQYPHLDTITINLCSSLDPAWFDHPNEIKTLKITGCSTDHIPVDFLRHLPSLEHFAFINGVISVVSVGVFDYTPLLQTITLTHNEIGNIDPHVFTSLNNLTKLYIQGNLPSNLGMLLKNTLINSIPSLETVVV